MESEAVIPWSWQESFGYSQAIQVTGPARTLVCAGETSMDDNGTPVHAGNMAAQQRQALDNLETVLRQAGFSLADVVRLNFYTTDIDAFFASWAESAARLGEAGCRPASTLLGVTRLAMPELMIEIEATAMQ